MSIYQLYPQLDKNNGTCPERPDEIPLHWWNVGLASLFILINGVISILFGLRLEKSLFISAVRCIVQLTIMGLILEDVFRTQHPVGVMAMIFILILLGANEVVFNKSRRRHSGMFLSVLISLGLSSLIVGIIGTRYAMSQTPFWEPQKFIPTMGMLLGNCMSGIAVGLAYTLTQLSDQKEKIETCLAFGATRWEATLPVAIEAVRLAMLPTINTMSVTGLISIPGMMTGQIIGGAPIMDAVKYQQIIIFMISASTGLSVLVAVCVAVYTCTDSFHRLRADRITSEKPWIYVKWNEFLSKVKRFFLRVSEFFCHCFSRNPSVDENRRGLLADEN